MFVLLSIPILDVYLKIVVWFVKIELCVITDSYLLMDSNKCYVKIYNKLCFSLVVNLSITCINHLLILLVIGINERTNDWQNNWWKNKQSDFLMSESINQSIRQYINQSINQSVNTSINPNQSVSWTTRENEL